MPPVFRQNSLLVSMEGVLKYRWDYRFGLLATTTIQIEHDNRSICNELCLLSFSNILSILLPFVLHFITLQMDFQNFVECNSFLLLNQENGKS